MKVNKKRYTIKRMAEIFGLSRGAYYKWLKTRFSNSHDDPDAEIVRLIREIVLKHNYNYGSPRTKKELNKKGIRVSKKKVARLMREHGLNARRMRKYTTTTDSKHSYPVCENILNRDFFAAKPGQKWVSDITYLRTLNGWLYLTVVIDLFDRKIIGWALSDSLKTVNTTIPAFEMAVKNRTPEKDFIFHSDRGVQYCAYSFRDVMRKYFPDVIQSMSRKANCWDNACAESFFNTLKSEEEKTGGKYSAVEVRRAVFFYIESYYNRVRMHSALDYVAPNDYYLSNMVA
ncbi:MAG: IS3 family transposase [Treponema sp.]|nr:IS3 family transposase [Treponema sp.]